MLLELVSDEIDHGNLVATPRFAKGLLSHHAKHRSDQAQPIFKEPLSQFQGGFSKFLKSKTLRFNSAFTDFSIHKKKTQPTKKKRVKCVYLPSLLFHDFDGLCDCLSFILPHLAALLEVAVTGVAIGLQFRQVGACGNPTSEMVIESCVMKPLGATLLWDVLGRT